MLGTNLDLFELYLRYEIRGILVKNQKKKSREIFRDMHWIGHHTKFHGAANVNQARRNRHSLEAGR